MTSKEKMEAALAKARLHPGGENLKPYVSTEQARINQLKSAVARKANNETRREIRDFLKLFKEELSEISDQVPSGYEVMKMAMAHALVKGNSNQAVIIAEKIAEYEKPKLSRVESDITHRDARDLTDEELEAAINEIEKSVRLN